MALSSLERTRAVDGTGSAPRHPATRPHRLPRRPALVASAAVLGAVLVVALLVGDAAPGPAPTGLPDPGMVTGWGLPLAHLALRLLAVLTVGQLLYAAYLAPAGTGDVRNVAPSAGATRALAWSTWTGAGWLLATVVAFLLTASSILGVPVWKVSAQGLAAAATQLAAGRASLWACALLVVVIAGSSRVAALPSRGARAGAWVLLLVALGAVTVPGVLAGHSSAADDHVLAVTALSVHVLTASLWVGGLAALLLHGRARHESVRAVPRFSTLALACITLLTLSGVAAAVLVAGTPTPAWATQGWVHLLALKTLLLLGLAVAGWAHRRATLPALAAGRPRAFVRLGAAEVALMAVTLTVSVALGSSAAPTPQTVPAPAAAQGGQPATAPPAEPGDHAATGDDADADPPASAPDAPAASDDETPLEDMSGHDHGDLSVTVLIDDQRFHVGSTVRPGQPVTVYNSSDQAATITATDGSFDVDVPARTFITFPAPDAPGDHPFTSRPAGQDADGFADTLAVRPAP